MNRTTTVFDRAAVGVTGLALIAIGAGAAAWEWGYLPEDRQRVEIPFAENAIQATWWPWALGAVALVLVLAGLRWLLAHRPGRRVGRIPVSATGDQAGQLSVDVDTIARCAADALNTSDHIRTARGTTRSDRGERVIELTATLEPSPSALVQAAPVLAESTRDVAIALDDTRASTRVLLRLPPPARNRRVR
ncbi:hypothetical protein [Rhodococcoides kyotonense]|uniref:Alkaline shock response membrane anchor protein AmaP n=1 Tax=Rhodococcoides kyotonense TaxID=398843 RepID=A0A239ME08_9NOCA|nr:hypothetical protein [Rhodococcus kyotonensis]SNT40896.1 hypothetical protein SAMN05421642_117103 [Rhodococcus kyotonensis]